VATAAHDVPGPRLQTAANFMLLHAAASLAVCGLSFAAPQRGVWFLGAAGLFLFGSRLAAISPRARSREQDYFPWRLPSAERFS